MVLTIVTVMSFLAASMTAMFMMNVNLTQSSFNGDIALTEAEVALSEVMYKLGQDDTHTYGKNNEEIRGHATPGFRADEAYHVLTFRSGSGFPRSTNNIGGSGPIAGEGRQVPVDCVHVYSTGVCRGQRRTIEAVIRKPPAPYGLCASGPIHSISPLTVTGISKAQTTYDPTKVDRPGHVVSNAGVKIDAPGSNITGYIKGCGPVDVAGPAQVAGGLRPNASNTVLLDIDIQALSPKTPAPAASPNEGGMTGVVEIVEALHESQKLDVMYYCGHDLKFEGPVQLDNAFLYVQGNLEVMGGVWGTGAIVVDGDVTITGGTSLAAANDSEVALLASGLITLRNGANNFFRGIIYSEKGLDAKNMVVIGSAVVNSPDPTQGKCELEDMVFVADEISGVIRWTSTSYSTAKKQNRQGPASRMMGFSTPGNPEPWWPEPDKDRNEQVNKIVWQLMGGNSSGDSAGAGINPDHTLKDPQAYLNSLTLSSSAVFPLNPQTEWSTRANTLYSSFQASAATVKDALQAWQDKQDSVNSMLPGPARDAAEAELAGLKAAYESALGNFQTALASHNQAVRDLAESFFEFVDETSDSDGSFRNRPGDRPTDVSRDFIFDLNRYLPYSDRLQVTYWQVLPSRN